MDVRPVGAIAAIRPVNEKRPENVTPPFAIDGTVPMDDGASSANANAEDCDLEEDVLDELMNEEDTLSRFPADDPQKTVNFFA